MDADLVRTAQIYYVNVIQYDADFPGTFAWVKESTVRGGGRSLPPLPPPRMPKEGRRSMWLSHVLMMSSRALDVAYHQGDDQPSRGSNNGGR